MLGIEGIMDNRKKRNKKELQRASNHLNYEILMFKALANELKSSDLKDRFIKDALFESFLIHLRGLLYFFYTESSRYDDVIVEDFFPCSKEKWLKVRLPKSDYLQKVQEKINKEVAHLTYYRLDVTTKEKLWRFFPKIAEEINKVIDIFLKNVPKELLGKKFKIDDLS